MRASIVAAVAIVLFAIPPSQAADPVTVTGSYLLGNPTAWAAVDACGTQGATEGLDSGCAAVPAGYDGAPVALTVSDALGSVVFASICFYDAAGYVSCDDAVVPGGATSFSVSSFGGVMVEWSVTFG